MNLQRAILNALRSRLSLPREQRGLGVSELATQLDVSDYLVAAAVSALSSEGLLHSVRGPGTLQLFLSPMALAISAARAEVSQ